MRKSYHPVDRIGERRIAHQHPERADDLRPAGPTTSYSSFCSGVSCSGLTGSSGPQRSSLIYFSGVLPSGGRTSKLFRKIPTMA